jgi:hypothetical protein
MRAQPTGKAGRSQGEIAMSLWEFPLTADDGSVISQTIVAEGATEPAAAESAARLLADSAGGATLARPGTIVPPDADPRWREVGDGVFPIVVSDAGRLALYARGTGRS